MYKLTYLPQLTFDRDITPVERVEITLAADVTLDELCEAFTSFTRACGFSGETVINWEYEDES